MKKRSEYLKDLEFSPTDSPTKEQLKERRNQLSLREHPDHNGNPEKFREVREAYDALTEGKYLDDDHDPQKETNPEELKSYVADRITSFMDQIAIPIKKNNFKLIGNKIVYIKNESDEDKFVKIDGKLYKVER